MIRQKRQDLPVFSLPLHISLPGAVQPVPQAVNVPDGFQDDVQLGHIVFDGHGGYTLFQSEMAKHKLIGLQCEKFAEIGCQDIFSVFTADFVYTLSNGPHLPVIVKKALHAPFRNVSYCRP